MQPVQAVGMPGLRGDRKANPPWYAGVKPLVSLNTTARLGTTIMQLQGLPMCGSAVSVHDLHVKTMHRVSTAHLTRCNPVAFTLQLGLWDKAVALAPAVSVPYWRLLLPLQRKADTMAKAAAPARELLPNLLAAGQVEDAVELLMRQERHEQAASIAAVAACG